MVIFPHVLQIRRVLISRFSFFHLAILSVLLSSHANAIPGALVKLPAKQFETKTVRLTAPEGNTAKRTAEVLASSAVGPDPVLPDVYAEPGRQTVRDYVAEGFQEYIDPFGGQLNITATDLVVPGNGGLDIKIKRSYNVGNATYGVNAYHNLGLGWTLHMGRILVSGINGFCNDVDPSSTQGNPVLEMPDGSRQVFYNSSTLNDGSPTFQTANRWKAECGPNFTGFIAYSPEGTKYEMTKRVVENSAGRSIDSWYVKTITDIHGNTLTINYANANYSQISTITASDGRIVSFTYHNAGTFNARVATIRLGTNGPQWTYGYTAIPNTASNDFHLTSVTRPDGQKWGYEYYPYSGLAAEEPNNFLLKRVAYPQSGWAGTFSQAEGYVEYRYKNVYFNAYVPLARTVALATKKTFGTNAGTWTYAYRPGTTGNYDVTDVTGPDGLTTYKHYGINAQTWQVGLLVEKRIGSVQVEAYEWGSMRISLEDNIRHGPGMLFSDAESWVPVLSKKTITRNTTPYTTTFYDHDRYGNPWTVVEAGPYAGNRQTDRTFYIDTAKWIVKQVKNETVSGVSSIVRSFTNGRLMNETRDGIKTEFTYTTQGDLYTLKNARGKLWKYERYKRGIPQLETWPESVIIERLVDDAGNVTSVTDGESKVIGYAYDGINRLTGVTPPLGNPVTIVYSNYDRTKTLTRGAYVEITTFNRYGRASAIKRGSVTTTIGTNALGQKVFESYPGASLGTTYTYDMLGRVRTQTNGGDGSIRNTTYLGNKTTVENERAKKTVYTYRAYGDPDSPYLMELTAPIASASMVMTRNGRGQITSVTQNNFTRSYTYHPTSFFLKTETDPEIGVTEYPLYDEVGNIKSKKMGSATSGYTTYTYDDLDRLETITYPGTTPAVTFSYYKDGLMKTVTSSEAVRSYTYDSNKNLDLETLTVDGISLVADYGYDQNDKLASLKYPQSNSTVTYLPDALGRPQQALPYATNITYWPNGQIRVITYANGTTSSYGQNGRQWPASLKVGQGTSLWVDSAYVYDGVGNLETVTDAVDTSFNRRFTYDALDRVEEADGSWGTGLIQYDGNGNIKKQQMGTRAITYTYDTLNNNNRLKTVNIDTGQLSYTYDSYGNISGNGRGTFVYDEAGNLSCALCSSAKPFTYRYDGRESRVVSSRDGIKTYEFYTKNGDLLMTFTPQKANLLTEHIVVGGKRVAQKVSDDLLDTTIILTSSPNPADKGQVVTLTATVSASSVPAGTVTFKDGAATLGTATLNAGKAVYSTSSLLVGSRQLTAVYGGNATHAGSVSAVLTQTVTQKLATTTVLSSSLNPALTGSSISLTATVSGTSPTGTVTFKRGTTTLGSANVVAGKAILSGSSGSTVGSSTLTATYSGDASHLGSTSAALVQHVVNIYPTVTTLTSSLNPNLLNQDGTMTATITSNGTPTGTVTFKDGTVTLGTRTVSAGRAVLVGGLPTLGNHNLTAIYNGDTSNAGSTSAVLLQSIVSQYPTAIVLTVSKQQITPGESVTLTARVNSNGTPTGTVSFKDGTTTLATRTLVNGQISLTGSLSATLGQHSVTAHYNGDELNATGVSAPVIITVVSSMTAAEAERKDPASDLVFAWPGSGTVTLNEVRLAREASVVSAQAADTRRLRDRGPQPASAPTSPRYELSQLNTSVAVQKGTH